MTICDLCRKPDGAMEVVSVGIRGGTSVRVVDKRLHPECTGKVVAAIVGSIVATLGDAAKYLNWPGNDSGSEPTS